MSIKREGIQIICDLDLKRYLGNWYEIGRLPLKSEKGMDNITAIYNLKKNGKIVVVNSGYKKFCTCSSPFSYPSFSNIALFEIIDP